MQELQQLCAALTTIGETVAFIKRNNTEEGDVVMESLLEFSVRYHPLHTTSPNIVDSLIRLAGTIDTPAIIAAGRANRRARGGPLATSMDHFVRLALGTDTALHRDQFWGAEHLLHQMREVLIELFARTRNGVRTVEVFQRDAEAGLQARMAATLPTGTLRGAQLALHALLDLAEQELSVVSNGQLELTPAHRRIIAHLRQRQATLQLPDVLE